MRLAREDQVARFMSRWLPAALGIPVVAAGSAVAALQHGLVDPAHAVVLATALTLAGIGGLSALGVRRLARRDRERRAAVDALAESEAQLRAIIGTATDAIITVDDAYRIRLFNEGAEATFRCPAAEAIGEPIDRFIHGRWWDADRHAARDAGETAGPRRGAGHELSGRRAGGEAFPVEARVSRVTVRGRVLYTLILRDVTQRRRAEAERERLLAAEQSARTEAEAANRSKDQFLALVSHELRTPLTPVLAWLRMLQSGTLDRAATGQAFEIIERNVKAQAQLVSDLLDVSRIMAGKLALAVRRTEIAGVVTAALDAVRPHAEAKGVVLGCEVAEPSLLVLGDAERLQQVLWNLLANAVKFTPQGGRVDVSARWSDDDLVEIAVRDTGKGIHPGFLPYVFDAFRQADSSATRAHGGLGLGLAIVRHLVEQHGGTVQVTSSGEGRGATFTVRLPAAMPALGPASRRAPVPHAATDERSSALAGRRILLVDDEPDTLLTLGTLFELSGADVRKARSAAEALGVLQGWRPDLLVSDISMPDEDGYALIRKIRALPPERGGGVPALALSAYARGEDRARALSAGFQGHVSKPIEPDALVAAIRTLACGATA